MIKIFPQVFTNCTWVVGRGLIPIWGVNWCGTILPKPREFDYIPNIRQVVNSPIIRMASGDRVDIRNFLPNEAISVLNAIVLNGDKDKICWTKNQNGEFSTKSFWDLYRNHHPKDTWSKFYWNKFIQPKVGAFLWRLSRNAIPVDSRLLSMGFKLASRCTCCENPDVETIDHLFVSGELAYRTWCHFSHIFHLSTSSTSIEQLAQVWLNNISLSSPSGICRNIIFGNVLWEIWKQRNEIVFGNGKRNLNLLIARVSATLFHHINALNISSTDPQVSVFLLGGYSVGASAVAGLYSGEPDSYIQRTAEPGGSMHARGAAGGDVVAVQHSALQQIQAQEEEETAAAQLQKEAADNSSKRGDHQPRAHDGGAAAAAQHSAPQNRLQIAPAGREEQPPTCRIHQASASRIQQGVNAATHVQMGVAAVTNIHPQQGAVSYPQLLQGPSFRVQRWQAPVSGMKLNIDGRTGEPPCTAGGGIIRDASGSFIGAFTFYLDNIVISIPEVEALLFAANLCKAKSWALKEIETTSQRLFDIQRAKVDPPWALIYKIRKIQNHLSPTPVIHMVSPRANGVAKALASLALSTKEGQIFFHPSELPPSISSILSLD